MREIIDILVIGTFSNPIAIFLWIIAIYMWRKSIIKLIYRLFNIKREYNTFVSNMKYIKQEIDFKPFYCEIRCKYNDMIVFYGNIHSLSQLKDILDKYPMEEYNW